MRSATTMLLVLGLAAAASADFILWNDETFVANISHDQGLLYDRSKVNVCGPGGAVSSLHVFDEAWCQVHSNTRVSYLYAHNASTIDVIGGSMTDLRAHDTCTVDVLAGTMHSLEIHDACTASVAGGEINYVYANDSSTLDLSGGSFGQVYVRDGAVVTVSGGDVGRLSATSGRTVTLSGGRVSRLHADAASTVVFTGRDFRLGDGLWLGQHRMHGTGILSGEWASGVRWSTTISGNPSTARILLTPEPATLALLALGGLGLLARKPSRRGPKP